MTASTVLGRAASCLESFAAGLCLAVVASAFLYAADARAETPAAADIPAAAVSAR